MQKISRIYLGNCGFMGAWYDGQLLDLTDPQLGAPNDTIINLENGGGKTSLLSLIFSCFETSQDRFLKHLQSKNNHFTHYFAQDGLPGVILVEWLMPPKAPGESAYRLVMGQAVSIRTGNDSVDSERMFFSFEARADLTLEDVPAPKLSFAPVSTMADFSRWIHDQQKRHPGEVYITRKQTDWQRHLREERFIDLEMLQMQVNFSIKEGAFDDGFLTFTTEVEFLKKFFHLTLPQDRAATLRESVATVCDKLRRKPDFQRSLVQLEKFQATLDEFSSAATTLTDSQAHQLAVALQGARIALALDDRSSELKAKQAQETEFEAAQREVAAASRALAERLQKDALSYRSAWHAKTVSTAKTIEAEADAAWSAATQKAKHVRAARVLAEIKGAEGRIAALEQTLDQTTAGLAPFREQVERQATLLNLVLMQDEQALRDRIAQFEVLDSQRTARVAQLKETAAQLGRDQNNATKEQAKLLAAEQSYALAREAAHADELLLSLDEPAAEAIERWGQTVAALQQEHELRLLEQTQHLSLERELRASELQESTAAAGYESQAKALDALVGEGEALRERLSQLPAMQSAAESDVVDPDSAALPNLLQQVIQASAREVSLADVRLAELNATKQSIEETGVASDGPDVALVVAVLREAGIRSARPFNEYLAHAIDSPAQARNLVLSDPARFSGVTVAPAEMEKVRQLDWSGRRPNKPVMVSPNALDIEREVAGFTVAPPATDAAYNLLAAANLKDTLSGRLIDLQRQRKAYYERQMAAADAQSQLTAYKERFGDGKLPSLRAEAERNRREGALAKERKVAAGIKADAARQAAAAAATAAQQCALRAAGAASSLKALERFKVLHEDGHQARVAELGALAGRLEQLEFALQAAAEEATSLENTRMADNRVSNACEAKAGVLAREYSSLKYVKKDADGRYLPEGLNRDLDSLRTAYKDAVSSYEAEESARAGVLREQLESARAVLSSKSAEFKRDYPTVATQDLAEFEGLDHSGLLPELDQAVVDTLAARTQAMAAARAAETVSRGWHQQNKGAPASTPEMAELSLGELDSLSASSDAEALSTKEQGLAALRAAEQALTNARKLGDQAKKDTSVAEMLRSAIGCSDQDMVLMKLELMKLTGKSEDELEDQPVVLEDDASSQSAKLVSTFNAKRAEQDKLRKKAQSAFDRLKSAVGAPELQAAEPEICMMMLSNDFEATCSYAPSLLSTLKDRIASIKYNLERMQADFDACTDDVLQLTSTGVSRLNSATSKCVPMGAPYVGGKPILKLRVKLSAVPVETRRQAIQAYLDHIIDTNVIPAKGADLVADVVMRMAGGRPLGLQLLKMVQDVALQYVPVDKISNSGGEGIVMAMFIYGVIAHTRAESQGKASAGGGPLFLDNPFAKATLPAMWRAQRLLASSMNIQLIFATAIQDYNALAEFGNFIRIRKAGQNSKTGRTHLELAKYKLNDLPAEADI